MRLYLVRHGIAEMRSLASVLDEDRALTARGREVMRRVSLGLARAGYIPEIIFSNPENGIICEPVIFCICSNLLCFTINFFET